MKARTEVYYSAEFNEIVYTTELIHGGIHFECSDDYNSIFHDFISRGIGFVFQSDWVYLGPL